MNEDAVIRLGSGDDLAAFASSVIVSDLRIVAAVGDDIVGMSECFLVVNQATFHMGSGRDVLFMQGEFLGITLVSMGSGDDTVTGNQMRVADDLRFQLGGGNDRLVAGSDWLTDFSATITANGSAGREDIFVVHPSAPTMDDQRFEQVITTVDADPAIDSLGDFLQLRYADRGGDVTDLGCP